MSSKKGTSGGGGSHGGDDRGGNQKEQKKVIKKIQRAKKVSEGKKYVTKKLGLVEKKAGPMDYLQKGKTTGMYASKLTGTKGGTGFYGQEASAATNEYLESIGEAKKGKQYSDGSWSYILTSKGKEMKYGKSDSAMGSGDPTGIMTSTAISQPMYKRQKQIQALTLGGLSLAMPMGAGTLMRMSAADAWKDKGQTGYNQYLGKFYSNVSGTTSSYGVKSQTTANGKEQEVSSANITDTRTGGKTRKSDETRFKSLVAVTTGSGSVAESQRTLMKRSGKTISSGTVST